MLKGKSFSKIFFSTFAVAFCLLALMAGVVILCVNSAEEKILAEKKTDLSQTEPFVPDEADSIRFLAIFDSEYKDAHNYYVLVSYQPQKNIFAIAPIPWQITETVGVKKRTLDDFYEQESTSNVLKAVSYAFNADVKKYVILTSSQTSDLIDSIGGLDFNVEKDVCYGDDDFFVAVRAGNQKLNGKMVTGLCENPENFKNASGCELVSKFAGIIFEQFKSGISPQNFEAVFSQILNISTTNLTYEDYVYRKDAFNYSAKNNINLTVVNPSGDFKVLSDLFTPNEKYIEEIKKYF